MNREILFRGKRVDNGEWVEGNYAFGYIYTNDPTIELDENYWEHSYGYAPSSENYHLTNRFEVIPESVGQFTGLTDKNGVKVVEGDIVYNPLAVEPEDLGFVCRYDGSGFVFNNIRFQDDFEFNLYDADYIQKRMEIIGNIHDNPELLTNE